MTKGESIFYMIAAKCRSPKSNVFIYVGFFFMVFIIITLYHLYRASMLDIYYRKIRQEEIHCKFSN